MRSEDGLVVLGYFCGVHGVRGALKVFSHTNPPQAIFDYQPWLAEIDGKWRDIDIKPLSASAKMIRVSLNGISDRNLAELWCGRQIAVRRSILPSTCEREGEYYWHDLIGLEVFASGSNDAMLGKVSGFMETAGHDVLRVQGEREYLIPWNYGGTIVSVDLIAGRMLVDWQEPV
ncbi:MAG: ribosome maturation factor RimM [Candidatus Porifericomitaceae bacterium WSBS_2022_MAG_OTU9]